MEGLVGKASNKESSICVLTRWMEKIVIWWAVITEYAGFSDRVDLLGGVKVELWCPGKKVEGMKTEHMLGRKEKNDTVCWENMKSLLVHDTGLDV